ncbi:MFS transporter [Arthrobacter sp. ISL-95]|uniref:MFS transporter n=1 Tax=Arthrobacter sp. ISL-95 TaxID=2819116 RepID=UPI001BED01A3|nr:MFS transporter [Arthrobacter sp. ISL-95]MBT2585418.1 MFS transporter [Arthrobacter sp. ISL-95]
MTLSNKTMVSLPDKTMMRPALVVIGLLLVASNLRAGITTIGPVLDQIRNDYGLTSALASGLVSLPLLAFAAVSASIPRLTRRLGLERTLGVGLAILACGLVLRSLPGLGLLWSGTALIGISIATLNVALPALVKRDFPRHIGQITGAYSAVQSVFAAAAAGIAIYLSSLTAAGWRLPLGIWAVLALIAIGVLAPQFRRRSVDPQGDSRIDETDPQPATGQRSPWSSALGWQVTAFMGLQSFGFFVFITWLPSIEASAGTSAATAGMHQLFLNAAGIAGSLLCSALIPRLRDQRILAVGAASVFVIASLGLLALPQLGGIWATVAGIAGGATIVLSLSFLGLRAHNHTQAASLSGMAQCIGYLLAAIGPVAVGALHDATGSWTPALILLISVFAALMFVGFLAGRHRVIT